jgi:hypothetical protein
VRRAYFYVPDQNHRTMKHVLFLSITALLMAGCAKRYTLKGNYREIPYAIPVKQPADTVWAQLMAFMNQEHIVPSIVKKKKHLIITDTYSFKDVHTQEDPNGKLEDSTKFVVLPKLQNNMSLVGATAYWTIRIQERKAKTAVLIELSKVTATYESKDGNTTKLVGNNVSTDRFEKKLQDFLTRTPARMEVSFSQPEK